ncbi:hypothetical protein [Methanosarcina sp.]|uniref:hypothetical protein n=1 Tax=Methanosarcina sp. TaxID=2213 RepID=UPI003BB53AF2
MASSSNQDINSLHRRIDDLQHHLEKHIDTQVGDLKELLNTRVEPIETSICTLENRISTLERWQLKILAVCLIIGIAIKEAWDRIQIFFGAN